MWGASRHTRDFCLFGAVSSRAPVWGASDLHLHLLILVGSFKSCPRVGGILVAVDDVKVVHSFKSCPRVGGIQGKPVICMTMIVSSRAPVWGASYFNRNYVAPRTVSSRAPVWGASRRFLLPFAASQWFQVVPPCGGHPATTAAGRPSMWFQVVPPCGGHRRRMLSGRLHRMFQVVPPCGGHPGGAIP